MALSVLVAGILWRSDLYARSSDSRWHLWLLLPSLQSPNDLLNFSYSLEILASKKVVVTSEIRRKL